MEQMISGDGTKLGGQLRSSAGSQLIGVDFGLQAPALTRFQHRPGLLHGEDAFFTEHITELR
ncbi:hypothetical protein D3C73_1465540 [compost metagenome]